MWLTLSPIAASLIVGALGWFRIPEEHAGEIERGIASVIRIEGKGKAGQDRVVVDGAELFAGEELAMRQGLIELAFHETRVHVVATGPLRMMLDSDQRVSLHEGLVKLVVPPQGVGFVVDTAQRKESERYPIRFLSCAWGSATLLGPCLTPANSCSSNRY